MNVTCYHKFKGEESDQIQKILNIETQFSKDNPLTADPVIMAKLTYTRKVMAVKILYPDKVFKRRGDRFIDESGHEYIVKALYQCKFAIIDDNHFIVFEHP